MAKAVQMGAATGAIGRPYVEYFSDPFIIGLEDDNANLLYHILRQVGEGGMSQHYYAFNTGGVGADNKRGKPAAPSTRRYLVELTLMLQEALLREAVKFEYDPILRSDIAVAIVNGDGKEVMDLGKEWLPRRIYGDEEYTRRVGDLRHRRYYGRDAEDKAGILRYTKVHDEIIDLGDIPPPRDERDLAWLLSLYWHVDQVSNSLSELVQRRNEGERPSPKLLSALYGKYQAGVAEGLDLPRESRALLRELGIGDQG